MRTAVIPGKALNVLMLVALIFSVIGLAFAGVGIGMYFEEQSFKRGAVKTDAVITEIYEYRSGDGYSHDVLIEYNIDGIEYAQWLGEYSSTMREGQAITVYADPQNPQSVRAGTNSLLGVIFSAFGMFFLIIGVIILLVNGQKRMRAKRLIATGHKIEADIIGVNVVSHIRINGRNPYVITCKGKNPFTGEERAYKSGYLTEDPSLFLDGQGISSLFVYIDENNMNKYYMDTDSISY